VIALGSRGPQPRQLARLFQLQYLENTTDTSELAEKLGVKPSTIYCYRWRLRKRLRKLAQKSIQDFSDSAVCPECLLLSLRKDHETGELVCTRCGLVTRQTFNLSFRLPFSTTYALSHQLAFGKSLGDTISYRDTYKILARVHGHNSEIPIRQITVMTQTFDPPLVKNMLRYASQMLKNLGLDRDRPDTHTLADHIGRTVRKIAGFLAISKMNVQPYRLVRSAVFLLLHKYGLDDLAREVRRRYPFNSHDLQIVVRLDELSRLEGSSQRRGGL